MADITFNTGVGSWSVDSDWVGGVKPGIGDTAVLDATSGNCDVNEDTAALSGLDMTGYTGTLAQVNAPHTIDVDGDVVLGGTLTAGAALTIEATGNVEVLAGTSLGVNIIISPNDVAANSHTLKTRGLCENVALVVANAGSTALAVSEDGGTTIKWASFSLGDGALYAGGAFDHDIGGNLTIHATADTFSQTGTWTQTASGNVANAAHARRFSDIVLAGTGVTSTLTGNLYTSKLTCGAGTVTGAFSVFVYPAANDFFDSVESTIFTPASLAIRLLASRSNAGDIHVQCATEAKSYGGSGYTLTMGGNFDCATSNLCVCANGAGEAGNLDINGQKLTAGAVTLGMSTLDRSGVLSCGGGIIDIASLASANVANLANALELDSAYITVSGIVNLSNVAVDNVACSINGGTVSNLTDDPTNKVHCHSTSDGGGNTAAFVDFDDYSPPGARLLAGAGR